MRPRRFRRSPVPAQATLEERVRLRAYLLAEGAGFPEGRTEEFWHRVEEETRGKREPQWRRVDDTGWGL